MEKNKEVNLILEKRKFVLKEIGKTASPNNFLSGYLYALEVLLKELGVEYK